MHARRLLPALAVLVAVAGVACSDPTSAPAGTALGPATRPSFGFVSNGVYYDSLNFPEAKDFVGFGVANTNCGPATGWACVAPIPFRPDTFDVAIHVRDRARWDTPETFRAMHGTLCQPYDNGVLVSRVDSVISHDAQTYDDMNYRCRNHMMTAIKASGYGVIYVTPNAKVSIPASGEATIRWAMSTFRTSATDWIDVWITPPEDHLKLPLDASLSGTAAVDLQGPPRRGIHVRMTSSSRTDSRFEIYQINDFIETHLATSASYESAIVTQTSTRRDTFEIKVSPSQVKFRMWKGDPDTTHAGWVPYATIPTAVANLATALTWTTGVVQFGHHSMGEAVPGVGGTWHWDDFSLSPAVAFKVIRVTNPSAPTATNNRYADSKHPDMTFASPTTAPGTLRFSAYGDRIQVSFDGAKWEDAVRRQAKFNVEGRFHSYQVAVPAGVARVSFKAKKDKLAVEPTNHDSGEWRVRDVAVWIE